MGVKQERGIWLADDGSWGEGVILILDRSDLTEEQYDRLVSGYEGDVFDDFTIGSED